MPLYIFAQFNPWVARQYFLFNGLQYTKLILYLYTRKNAQVVTNQEASCNKSAMKPLQDLVALLVPSCCNKLLSTCNKVDDDCRLTTSLFQQV